MKAGRQINRRLFVRSVLASGAAATAGCIGPTLPLPPPDAPDQIGLSSSDAGIWELRGHCSPGAVVLVENLTTGAITGVADSDATGQYFVRVAAELCDEAAVWELVDDSVSGRTFFLIEKTLNGESTDDSCT